jgi:hypothetical protein
MCFQVFGRIGLPYDLRLLTLKSFVKLSITFLWLFEGLKIPTINPSNHLFLWKTASADANFHFLLSTPSDQSESVSHYRHWQPLIPIC